MLAAENCFKANGEFCEENADKSKTEFGKHSIPILQSSNVKR
jgi:hypothetical protein